MVPPNSDRISPVPPYSGYSSLTNLTCTRLSLSLVCLSRALPLQFASIIQVLQPHYDVSQWFGLIRVRSPLLAESLIVFFSSRYLDVSVPWVTVLRRRVFNPPGFPIRTSMDQWLFAPPHSFSQLITSFVVSESLGIPRTPLFASYSLPIKAYL